jgi:hypothetical protein
MVVFTIGELDIDDRRRGWILPGDHVGDPFKGNGDNKWDEQSGHDPECGSTSWQ